VIGEVDRGSSVADAAPRVVTTIEAAVHPEFVAVFVGEAGEGWLRPVAVAPAGREVREWPADSRFLGVIQALGAPLEVTSAGAAGLVDGLPAEDLERLERDRYDLAVPILAPGRKGLLALGPKRSGEPWDREEREVLAAVAAGLGLLLRREASAETPTMFPPIVLHDRYRLERPLGRGGMGVVYEATDRQLERRVAVKLLREDRPPRPDDAERFRREARTLAAFSHPNVVTIHDFGLGTDGRSFLVMEFLVGPTLREMLKREGGLAVPRALEILGGIAAAVEAAHRLGIVHRDLKPENVILARGETGEVPKVLDFGLARLMPLDDSSEAETATRALAGTPRYMAPEQMSGGAVDAAWDVWALTVIAYEVLTGAHPFSGTGTGDWRAAVLAGRVGPARLPSSGTVPVLDAFFRQALAVEKAKRPSSPGEVLGRLREALADRSRLAQNPDREPG
jgi:serine/threonine-protein kinase